MSNPLRVLIVEDSEDDALLLLRELRQGGYEPEHERVYEPETLSAALDGKVWDIVITDYVLPRLSGLAVLRVVQEKDADLPVIIVSGKIGQDTAVEAMKSGAQDYISKDNLARLVPAVARELRDAEVRRGRSRVEEELKEAQEKYRRIFSEARDGIALIDSETGQIVDCNPELERQSGRKLGELARMKVWELRPPARREAARRKFLEIKEKGRGGSGEFEFQKPNGEIVPVEYLSTVITLHGKQFVHSVTRDITERKRAEEAVLLERQRLDDVINFSNAGLLLLDGEARVTYANRLSQEWFGPFDQLKGQYCWQVFQMKDPERECAALEVIKTGKPVTSGFFVRVIRGEKRYLHVAATPVKDREGNVRQVTEVVVDITEAKQAKDLSDALNRINSEITSTFDADEIMRRVVTQSSLAVGAEASGVLLRSGDYWEFKHLRGVPPELTGARMAKEDIRLSVLQEIGRGPVFSNDVRSDERFNREWLDKLGVRSFLAAPVVQGGETTGFVFFANRSEPVAFTETQIDFAGKLGVSVSLAIQNARLYAVERNIANTLQEALLTVPEHIEGVSYGHLYRSATEAAKVGGDFFDLFELEHHKVGIVIGDVSGKGLEAAALASLSKNTIRAYAYEESSPAGIMAKTNEVVMRSSEPSSFVTVFLGILDVLSGELTYCSAGHPPGILKRNDLIILPLVTQSPVIGVAPFHYVDRKIRLGRGDVLVLYTDGATEARCEDGSLFGEERLTEAVERLDGMAKKEYPSELFNQIMACTGGSLSDDLAFLSISLDRGRE